MGKLIYSHQSVSYRKLFDLLLKLIDPSTLDVIAKSNSHANSDSSNEVLILESKNDYKVVDYNE